MGKQSGGTMKTNRKVYYLNYPDKRVPMIRISGKFLNRYGINIGDKIEVDYSEDQITIKKLNQSTRKEDAI